MSTHVIMPDGTEADLTEHLRGEHQKGTTGYTDAYLASLHDKLHEPRREPRPEHDHPVAERPDPRVPAGRLPLD